MDVEEIRNVIIVVEIDPIYKKGRKRENAPVWQRSWYITSCGEENMGVFPR